MPHLSDAIGSDGPFDYIIASHVLEHLANPVGWLQDVEKVLTSDGLVSLVIPDKRFCFDINRAETRPQDWVDWYLRDLRAPSYSQLFDFFAHVTTIDGMVDTAAIWAGTADYAGTRRADVPDADAAAFASCLQYRETSRYMDVHTGVYTPRSLLSLLELSIKLDLVHSEVACFAPTRRDSLEFHLTLRGVADREQALGSIEAAKAELPGADAPATVDGPGAAAGEEGEMQETAPASAAGEMQETAPAPAPAQPHAPRPRGSRPPPCARARSWSSSVRRSGTSSP